MSVNNAQTKRIGDLVWERAVAIDKQVSESSFMTAIRNRRVPVDRYVSR